MSDLNKIWSDGAEQRSPLTEAQLLAYLEGRLPEQERRRIEELLAEDGPESDALEGLRELSVEETRSMRQSLNLNLQKTLHKKRRRRRGMTEQRWTWLAIGVILLLAIVCYAVMYLAKH